jgi:AcrR family transcriptional regulator
MAISRTRLSEMLVPLNPYDMEWTFQMSTSPANLSRRADAVRNRQLVLEATKVLLAAEGAGVTVEAIARRAGVGAATVVRSFGNKEALFDTAVADLLEPLIQLGRDALTEPDAEAALRRFLLELIAFQSAHRIMGEQLRELDLPATAAQRADLNRAGLALVTRARDTGAIRADLEPDVLFEVLGEMTHAIARTSGAHTETFITVIMDGLRPGS